MSLPELKFNVGDEKTLNFQLREADGVTPVDITGLTFTFFARDEPGAPTYTIAPVTGIITDAVNGKFQFDVTMPSAETKSFYWIERENGAARVDTFPPAEGTPINILKK
jgi:hypothetical protein